MSAVFTPYNGNIVQIGVFTDGDTYTHVRAGTISNPGISCDSEADLPAQAGGIPGYFLEQGSTAHAISENTIHTITSSGAWIKQDEASRMDVYTKTEIDTKFADYTTTADQQVIDGQLNAAITALETILTNIKDIHLVRNTTQNYIGLSMQDATGKRIRIIFGKLNSTTNYMQLYGGDNDFIDKGYITFDVSRNIDIWSAGG